MGTKMDIPAHPRTPHRVIHPGEHLLECIESRHLSVQEFAQLAGISPLTIEAIIIGRHPITFDIATCIERALGIMPELWFVLQAKWQRHQDTFQASA